MEFTKTPEGLYAVELHAPGRDDKVTYEFGKWGAEEALEGWMDLMGVAAKPAGLLAADLFGPGADGLKTELNRKVLDAALSDLAAGMVDQRRAVVMRLLNKLCTRLVFADGQQVTKLTHFGQDLGLLFEVARANAQVQYGDFLVGLAGRLGVSRTAAPKQAESQAA